MPDIIFDFSDAVNSRRVGQQWVNVNVGFTDGFVNDPTGITVTGAPVWLTVSLVGSGLVKQIEFNTASPVPFPVAEYDITVEVSNAFSETTGPVPYTFYVKGNTSPTLSTLSLVKGQWDEPLETFINSGTGSGTDNYTSESTLLSVLLVNRPYWLNSSLSGTYPNQVIRIFGTPNATGLFLVQVAITNEVGASSYRTLSINVAENRLYATCPKKDGGNNDIRAKFILDLDVQYNTLTPFNFFENFALGSLPFTQEGNDSLGNDVGLPPTFFLPQQGTLEIQAVDQSINFALAYQFVRDGIREVEIVEKPLTGNYTNDSSIIYEGVQVPELLQSNKYSFNITFASTIENALQVYINENNERDTEYLNSIYNQAPDAFLVNNTGSDFYLSAENYCKVVPFIEKTLRGLGAKVQTVLIGDDTTYRYYESINAVFFDVTINDVSINKLWALNYYDDPSSKPDIPDFDQKRLDQVMDNLCYVFNAIAGVTTDRQGYFICKRDMAFETISDNDIISLNSINNGQQIYDGMIVLTALVANTSDPSLVTSNRGFSAGSVETRNLLYGDVKKGDISASGTNLSFWMQSQIYNPDKVFVYYGFNQNENPQDFYVGTSSTLGFTFFDFSVTRSFPLGVVTTVLVTTYVANITSRFFESVEIEGWRKFISEEVWDEVKDRHEKITLRLSGKNFVPYKKYRTEPGSKLGYIEMRPIRITKNHNDCTSEIEFIHIRNL